MLSEKEQHALSFFRNEELLKARELYTEICEESGENAESWHMLSMTCGMLGLYGEAESCARKTIDLKPELPGAYNTLGNALLAQGRTREAIDSFSHALRLNPVDADLHASLGNVWNSIGKYDDAIECYRKSLMHRSGHAETVNNMGAAMMGAYRWQDALECFEEALNVNPLYIDARFNQGKVYQETGRFAEAIACYESILKQRPEHIDSRLNIAVVMQRQFNLDGAYSVYFQILENNPGHIKATIGIASVLLKQEKFEEAAVFCRLALDKDLHNAEIQHCLGHVYRKSGDTETAIKFFRDSLDNDPHQTQAEHFLAMLGDIEVPAQANERYIESLFNGYANTFDEHLTGVLEYRIPEYLKQAIEQVLAGRTGIDVLDLGCGTGLCGVQLSKITRHLVGVDLSQKMLDKARNLGLYDELILGDVMKPLEKEGVRFDLIIAADVFIYIGDLEKIFNAAANALTSDGIFAFSIESNDDGQSYILHSGGRYAQSLDYILDLAARNHFETITVNNVVLRKEGDEDVDGFVVVLRGGI